MLCHLVSINIEENSNHSYDHLQDLVDILDNTYEDKKEHEDH